MKNNIAKEVEALMEFYKEAYESNKKSLSEIQSELEVLRAENRGAVRMIKGFARGKGKNSQLIKKPQELAAKTKAKIDELEAKEQELKSEIRDLKNIIEGVENDLEYEEA
jgi:seryl-tRNA synthetase